MSKSYDFSHLADPPDAADAAAVAGRFLTAWRHERAEQKGRDIDDEWQQGDDETDADYRRRQRRKQRPGETDEDYAERLRKEDEEEEEDEDEGKSSAASRSVRKRERARWANVLSNPKSKGRLGAAIAFLSGTRLHSQTIIKMLASAPAATATPLGHRIERYAAATPENASAGLKVDERGVAHGNDASALAAAIIRAGDKARRPK